MFYPGDLVTHTGEWEIWSVHSRLLDNPGEVARIHVFTDHKVSTFSVFIPQLQTSVG